MKYYNLNTFLKNRITIILLNGSAMQHFNRINPLVRYLLRYNCNLISMELPGHGTSNFDKIIKTNEFLEQFNSDITQLINEIADFAIIAFSLGGLSTLKIMEQKLINPKFTILIGTGFSMNEITQQKINTFTTTEFFERMGWCDAMKKFHADGWQYLLPSLAEILDGEKGILSKADKIENENIFIILGDDDQAFPANDQFQLLPYENFHKYKINNCTHFDYFTKSWPQLKNILEIILKDNIESTDN